MMSKIGSHVPSLVIMRLNHSWNFPSSWSSGITVLKVIRKCFLEDDWGWPYFLRHCIHVPSNFLGMDCLDAHMIFLIYICVLLVMKKSILGMLILSQYLTSSFITFCSLTCFHLYLIAAWWKMLCLL